jgi:hypothetical protein
LLEKRPLCAGRVDPHGIRRAHQPDWTLSPRKQIERYALFAHLTWCGSTSLPLALKKPSFALAGSIPTEFGELINLSNLHLEENKLSGTPSLLILHGVVVRVYHLLQQTSSYALAGSIPTEIGKLINLIDLFLWATI